MASYYIDELRRAVAPLRSKLKLSDAITRDAAWAKWTKSPRPANWIGLSCVNRSDTFIAVRNDNSYRNHASARLLALARNDGFLSESALRRIEIERERAGKWFGPYDGQITDPHLIALAQPAVWPRLPAQCQRPQPLWKLRLSIFWSKNLEARTARRSGARSASDRRRQTTSRYPAALLRAAPATTFASG